MSTESENKLETGWAHSLDAVTSENVHEVIRSLREKIKEFRKSTDYSEEKHKSSINAISKAIFNIKDSGGDTSSAFLDALKLAYRDFMRVKEGSDEKGEIEDTSTNTDDVKKSVDDISSPAVMVDPTVSVGTPVTAANLDKRTTWDARSDEHKEKFRERSVDQMIDQINRLQQSINRRRDKETELTHAQAGRKKENGGLGGYIPSKLQLGKLKTELERLKGRNLTDGDRAHLQQVRGNIAQYVEEFRKTSREYDIDDSLPIPPNPDPVPSPPTPDPIPPNPDPIPPLPTPDPVPPGPGGETVDVDREHTFRFTRNADGRLVKGDVVKWVDKETGEKKFYQKSNEDTAQPLTDENKLSTEYLQRREDRKAYKEKQNEYDALFEQKSHKYAGRFFGLNPQGFKEKKAELNASRGVYAASLHAGLVERATKQQSNGSIDRLKAKGFDGEKKWAKVEGSVEMINDAYRPWFIQRFVIDDAKRRLEAQKSVLSEEKKAKIQELGAYLKKHKWKLRVGSVVVAGLVASVGAAAAGVGLAAAAGIGGVAGGVRVGRMAVGVGAAMFTGAATHQAFDERVGIRKDALIKSEKGARSTSYDALLNNMDNISDEYHTSYRELDRARKTRTAATMLAATAAGVVAGAGTESVAGALDTALYPPPEVLTDVATMHAPAIGGDSGMPAPETYPQMSQENPVSPQIQTESIMDTESEIAPTVGLERTEMMQPEVENTDGILRMSRGIDHAVSSGAGVMPEASDVHDSVTENIDKDLHALSEKGDNFWDIMEGDTRIPKPAVMSQIDSSHEQALIDLTRDHVNNMSSLDRLKLGFGANADKLAMGADVNMTQLNTIATQIAQEQGWLTGTATEASVVTESATVAEAIPDLPELLYDVAAGDRGVSYKLVEAYPDMFKDLSPAQWNTFIDSVNTDPDLLKEAGVVSGKLGMIHAGDQIRLDTLAEHYLKMEASTEVRTVPITSATESAPEVSIRPEPRPENFPSDSSESLVTLTPEQITQQFTTGFENLTQAKQFLEGAGVTGVTNINYVNGQLFIEGTNLAHYETIFPNLEAVGGKINSLTMNGPNLTSISGQNFSNLAGLDKSLVGVSTSGATHIEFKSTGEIIISEKRFLTTNERVFQSIGTTPEGLN